MRNEPLPLTQQSQAIAARCYAFVLVWQSSPPHSLSARVVSLWRSNTEGTKLCAEHDLDSNVSLKSRKHVRDASGFLHFAGPEPDRWLSRRREIQFAIQISRATCFSPYTCLTLARTTQKASRNTCSVTIQGLVNMAAASARALISALRVSVAACRRVERKVDRKSASLSSLKVAPNVLHW